MIGLCFMIVISVVPILEIVCAQPTIKEIAGLLILIQIIFLLYYESATLPCLLFIVSLFLFGVYQSERAGIPGIPFHS